MQKVTLSNLLGIKFKTVNNAVITLGDTDDTGKGKHFKSRFIQAGLVKIENHGIVLLKKETLDDSLNSMVGAPVIIKHQDVNEKNANELRCGVISDAYFNEADGWYYAEGIIWDEKAQKLVNDKNWSVSCSYDFLGYDDEGGVENNIKYDKEFTKLNFTHLAIVNNPRYERANIVFNSKDENGKWVTIKGTHVFIPDGKSLDDVMEEKGWTKGHKDFGKAMGDLQKLADKSKEKESKDRKSDTKKETNTTKDTRRHIDRIEKVIKGYNLEPQEEEELLDELGSFEAKLDEGLEPREEEELREELFDFEDDIKLHQEMREQEGKQSDKSGTKSDALVLGDLQKLGEEEVRKRIGESNIEALDYLYDTYEEFPSAFDSQKMKILLNDWEKSGDLRKLEALVDNLNKQTGSDIHVDVNPKESKDTPKDRKKRVNEILERHYDDYWETDAIERELSEVYGVDINKEDTTNALILATYERRLDDYDIDDMRKELEDIVKDKKKGIIELDERTSSRVKDWDGYGVSGEKADKLAKKYGFGRDDDGTEAGNYSHWDSENDVMYYATVGETDDGYVVQYTRAVDGDRGWIEQRYFEVPSVELGFQKAGKLMKKDIKYDEKERKLEENRKEWKPSNKTDNEKENDMTLIRDLKRLIKRVENEKGEPDMDEKEKVENSSVDKRKIIDEVGGILKGKVDEEVWRTIIGKLEKLSYNGSEDDKKVENEDEEDKEKVEELKKEEKEAVENKCKNSKVSFDKINEIYNSVKTLKEDTSYVSRDEKLKNAEEYFG